MKHAWLAGVVCVAMLVGIGGCRCESPSADKPAAVDLSPPPNAVLTDLQRPWRVDYLVIAADELVEALGPLVAHRRACGMSVGVARMSDVRELGGIETFLAVVDDTWPSPAPTFLLLAGDAAGVPTVVKPGRFIATVAGMATDHDIATDFDYARSTGVPPMRTLDNRQDVPASRGLEALDTHGRDARATGDAHATITRHIGRLPASSPDELAVIIRKIIDYETTLPPGPWQRKVSFVASVGGYGRSIDRALEDQFAQIVSAMPPMYDTEVAYSAPTSNFCPWPPKFNDNAIDMLNRGCLFYVFIGHGSPTAVDTIRWQGQAYPILDSRDAERIDARSGPPVMVVLACSTGRFDRGDCLGSTLMKTPGGPVAFIGGSRITQPYGNVLLADAMARRFFHTATIGEALTLAKADVLAHPSSPITLKADLAASLLQGGKNLPLMRQDVVEHYNLLGDPAMRLRHPDGGVTLALAADGRANIAAPGYSHVTVELLGDRMARVEPAPMPEDESAAMARYRAANTYVLWQSRVELHNGTATIDLPPLPSPNPHWLRATTETGAAAVKLITP